MPVSDLMAQYGTDKNTGHAYGPVYDKLLEPLKDSARRVLEIGVDKGRSLKVWWDYFDKAWIHGLDLDPPDDIDLPRIVLHRGNQNDVPLLRQLGSVYGPFDFVCDDGSHRPEDQIVSLLNLWQHVTPGGVYVIEDLQEPGLWLRLFEPWTVDLRAEKGVYDDAMLVLHKD